MDARVEQFIQAMDDDLNTADGIAALFDLVRDINTFLASPKAKEPMEYAAQQFDRLADVLGLLYNRKKESLDDEIEELIAQRQQARKREKFCAGRQDSRRLEGTRHCAAGYPTGCKMEDGAVSKALTNK